MVEGFGDHRVVKSGTYPLWTGGPGSCAKSWKQIQKAHHVLSGKAPSKRPLWEGRADAALTIGDVSL
jgi:hypothetical protein